MNDPVTKPLVVLVVDDEPQIRRLLHLCLERNGYAPVEAATAEQGIDQAIAHQPDLVLLDLGLPDTDGLTVLQRIREWSQVPIIVLSVRGREEDKIKALDGGANDYLTKPFSTGELLARLRVWQRYARESANQTVFNSGELEVDLTTRTVKLKGQPVRLTATEYSLLHLFIQHAGKVLTHGQLLREIWGSHDEQKTGPLRVYVGYLRGKLEVDPAKPRLLLTEPGVGYRLALID
ncbi:MAG TPA: response regulator transcription factor [Verrucomicrobiae bacterium]|nr:response regulator transcription factor [Verrucomicrobiae bacterium]